MNMKKTLFQANSQSKLTCSILLVPDFPMFCLTHKLSCPFSMAGCGSDKGTPKPLWLKGKWVWVKKGYLKNPIGKKKINQNLWSPRVFFLTHGQMFVSSHWHQRYQLVFWSVFPLKMTKPKRLNCLYQGN